MPFFVKRGVKVQGPFSRKQIVILAIEKKIGGSDEVGNSPEGPFQELSAIWNSLVDISADNKKSIASPITAELIQNTRPATEAHTAKHSAGKHNSEVLIAEFVRQTTASETVSQKKKTESQKTLMLVGGLFCLPILFLLAVTLFVVIIIQLNSRPSSEPIATNDLDVAPSTQVNKSEFSQRRPQKDIVAQPAPTIMPKANTPPDEPDVNIVAQPTTAAKTKAGTTPSVPDAEIRKEFTIIETDPWRDGLGNNALKVRVRVKKILPEARVGAISKLIYRNFQGQNYQHVRMWFYLPETDPHDMAWAETVYEPTDWAETAFKPADGAIKRHTSSTTIMGFKKQPIASTKAEERVVYIWHDHAGIASSVMTVYYSRENKPRMRREYPYDKSVRDTAVLIEKSRGTTTIRDDPHEPERFWGRHDYIVVDSKGRVAVHDDEGFVKELTSAAIPSKSQGQTSEE